MSASSSIDMAQAWVIGNKRYLDKELDRLRLLLRRRIRWLQTQWRSEPRQGYQGLVISDDEVDRLASSNDADEFGFYSRDSEASAISSALAELNRELHIEGQRLLAAGRPAAIDVLQRLFGLTKFERDIVLLCAAPDLDPAFERLYAYVQDDATRKFATPHLALALFGGDGEAWLRARESLMPHAVLRRYRMIMLEPGPFAASTPAGLTLHLDERVANYLLGVNRLDERVANFLQPIAPSFLAPDHSPIVDKLQRRIEEDGKQGRWPAINLVSPVDAGQQELARTLCERAGLQLFTFNASALPPQAPERSDVLQLLEREAVLSQFALYVDAETLHPNPSLANDSAIENILERLSVFLIVGSRGRWRSDRKVLSVQVSRPDARGQRAMWQQALSELPHSLNGDVENLVQQFTFDAPMMIRTISAAQDRVRMRTADSKSAITSDDLWQACREQTGIRLDELAQRIVPCHTWDDIILPPDIYAVLQEIGAQVALRPQVYETWGFGAKLNRGRGISALFAGPSGTGKTMAAEILACHLNLDLFRIDLSGVVSKYIGETEKNLRRVFDAAEQCGAILFFDEADALFGKRSEVKDSHDRYANIEINYLLQRMEDYRGLAILATNKKSHLDQAFMRRLRFVVDFPFPDVEQRTRIWQRVFPKEAAVDGLSHPILARMEISGGNIKNIALNAAFGAAAQGGPIRMEHVYQAARREYAKIDKLVPESDFRAYCALTK